MDFLKPIYTETAQCQDCYKCLRQCQVKAIQIQDGHARVMHDYCVMCGHCVQTCPVGAKKVRNDLEKAKLLIENKNKVIVSLAPSFVTEFDDIDRSVLISAIKKLGFWGVSETALGAQEVSANVAELIRVGDKKVYISSACPSVVALIKKYHPEFSGNVTDMLSPVLAHCKMLRKEYGNDIGVVFVGPCIAKKVEADLYNGLMDVALTFQELRNWLEIEGVALDDSICADDVEFVPGKAQEGALYPIDGGMIAGIKANCSISDMELMAFSGISNIQKVLASLNKMKTGKKLFLELLACERGCVNGPSVSHKEGTALKRLEVIENSEYSTDTIPRRPSVDISAEWGYEMAVRPAYSEIDIRKALEQVGKFSDDDELNCSGCGYDSCREFAKALIEGKAEPNMCVSYMRQLAHKKADALIRTMPSGLVIVDENLRILESNKRFAELLGDEVVKIYESCPGLEGAYIEKLVPFARLFTQVLNKGTELIEKDIKMENVVLHVTIFTIEPHRLVGCFLQDITVPAVHKEQIINKTKEVIAKNLATVQQIAYLLGENASESEVMLNSVESRDKNEK